MATGLSTEPSRNEPQSRRRKAKMEERKDKGKDKLPQVDLSAFLPTSFGAKKKGVNVSKRFEATKRSGTVQVVKKRKRELTEEELEEERRKHTTVADATKVFSEGGAIGGPGYVVIGEEKPHSVSLKRPLSYSLF